MPGPGPCLEDVHRLLVLGKAQHLRIDWSPAMARLGLLGVLWIGAVVIVASLTVIAARSTATQSAVVAPVPGLGR
jgi:hypothetical protein